MKFELEFGLDSDGDGFTNNIDWCPNEWGPSWGQGCPEEVDFDGDGVPDNEDSCPNDWGPEWNNGCPEDGGDVDVDSDGDGWFDDEDNCPFEWGTDYGCPTDEDFGGYNSWDAYCKGEYGSQYYYDDVDDGCFVV